MISVLTLTYQRKDLLEEAIHSFLNQTKLEDAEMVIINDSPLVEYRIDNPKVKIINLNKRFSSVGKKLEWGFTQCKGDIIYRLDDDDLLTPWALELQREYHTESPNSDVYRCQKHYFFCNNKYEDYADSVNNGNAYRSEWIKGIEMIDKSMVKILNKEIKELEKHKAKNQKIYEKMTGKAKEEVIDEDDDMMAY